MTLQSTDNQTNVSTSVRHGLTRRVPRPKKSLYNCFYGTFILVGTCEYHEVAEASEEIWFEALREQFRRTYLQAWLVGFTFAEC